MSNIIKRNFVGQWIKFTMHGKNGQIGFILDFVGDAATVAIPSTKKTMTIPLGRISDNEIVLFSKKDLEELLDIALLLNDIEWAKALHNRIKAVKENDSKTN